VIIVIIAIVVLIFALILGALLFKLIFHFVLAAFLLVLIAAVAFLVYQLIKIGRRVERVLDHLEGREADADLRDVGGHERRRARDRLRRPL
jgi:uncharacterized membrane protein